MIWGLVPLHNKHPKAWYLGANETLHSHIACTISKNKWGVRVKAGHQNINTHAQLWQTCRLFLQTQVAASYLCTGGWTSSSPQEGSCRTGAPGESGACRLFAPRIAARRSGLPPGARRAQALPLSRDKESRPPAWGLPGRDSSSLRIGQLSGGDPRRSGGKKLGRSSDSLSSSS